MNEVSRTAQMPTSAFAEAVLLLSLGAEFVTKSLHARGLVSQRVKPYPRPPLCPLRDAWPPSFSRKRRLQCCFHTNRMQQWRARFKELSRYRQFQFSAFIITTG